MKKVLLLDNFDSFTYNVAHIIREKKNIELHILRADEVLIDRCEDYDGIIFSPGPDLPAQGNIMEKILAEYSQSVPLLGICLGMQAIALWAEGRLERLPVVAHGKTVTVYPTDEESRIIPRGNNSFIVGLYHSWQVSKEGLPPEIRITSISEEGVIMGIRHSQLNIEGIQFHPESIMTPQGKSMLWNWLSEL